MLGAIKSVRFGSVTRHLKAQISQNPGCRNKVVKLFPDTNISHTIYLVIICGENYEIIIFWTDSDGVIITCVIRLLCKEYYINCIDVEYKQTN